MSKNLLIALSAISLAFVACEKKDESAVEATKEASAEHHAAATHDHAAATHEHAAAKEEAKKEEAHEAAVVKEEEKKSETAAK